MKKRILVATEFFPRTKEGDARGGVEIRSWQVAKRLAKQYEIIVITSLEDSLPKEDIFFDIRVLRVGPRRRYTQKGALVKRILFMIGVYRKIIKLKPQLVDAQSIITYLPSFYAAKKLNIKSVMTCHDVWQGRWMKLFGFMGIIGEIFERFYLKLPWNKFIANSQYTKNSLIKSGIDNNKIEVVHNGIDFQLINSINVEQKNDFSVCSVTRLVDYKRVIDLLHAVALVKNKFPDVKCNIIGSGPELNNLKNAVKKLKIELNVNFLGFVDEYREVISEIKKSNVFCLTSTVEGFGIVIAEAMACGTPVVATDISPIREVTKNGQGAILFKPKDVQALSKAIIKIFGDRQIANDLSKKGKEISLNYNWNNLAELTLKIYHDLI
ncbi:glycosyltransferase family 4 protein [Patescibacteria group bacterium]|nr:glycosyltransferase family 4 protein [Patescibacteria group bacterium]